MLQQATGSNVQEQNGFPTNSTGTRRPLGRPTMPSLRSRTSPLKFFASSSTPKPQDRHGSHQDWEKEYLHGLRSNRPARPSGARPPPGSIPNLGEAIHEVPLRTSSALSFRPSLPVRQTSPCRKFGVERCSSALPHRREASHILSSAPTVTEQTSPSDGLAASAVTGRPVAVVQSEVVRSRDVFSATRTPSGVYKESEQRLVEKEEARQLREALEMVDLKEEARLHAAAQAEASELVWTHQNTGDPLQNKNAPYLYKKRLWSTSHARSQSDVPIATKAQPEGACPEIQRPVSEDSKVKHSNTDSDHAPRVAAGNGQNGVDGLVDSSKKAQTQPTGGHASWDSPQKKAYMNLSFSLPQVKSHGRRRSSGSKTRTPSGSLFRNPDDMIYEEPEEAIPLSSSMRADCGPLQSTSRRPVTRVQAANQPCIRAMTDSVQSKGNYSRTEIHCNPPSQSRNPSYLQNAGPPTTSNRTKDGEPQKTEERRQDGVEIRSDDIRAATSMKLRDRSPKLPSPTVVSNVKGRPIVSFDRNWTPCKTDLKLQGSLPQHPSSQDEPLSASATAYSKPPLPVSTASAPAIPTINFPEPPSIQIDEAPPIPSISVSAAPSVSISTEATPKGSDTEKPKSPRQLPVRSKEAVAQPPARPLPHHSSTAPVHTTIPHWSPAQRRATAQCAGCALPISGRIVRASSQRFHPECFICFHCSEQLECVAFYPEPDNFRNDRIARIRARAEGEEVSDEAGKSWEDDGDESLRFYCHLDFHEKFSPRCRSCKTPIEGEVVVACGGEWHVGHFFCAQCGDPFDPKTPFVEKDGYAWCVGCHTNRFSGRCRGCKKPVVDLVVRALGGEWHECCFCCKVSMQPFHHSAVETKESRILIRASNRSAAALSKTGDFSPGETKRSLYA